MVKKNTNEHDYYKPLRAFLTYHFGKTDGNETKLANVLHYCKTNWARISEHEIDGGDLDENVKTLLEIQPMDIARYFKYLAYNLVLKYNYFLNVGRRKHVRRAPSKGTYKVRQCDRTGNFQPPPEVPNYRSEKST